MERITLIESERTAVALSREQAIGLEELGRKLAGKVAWWGDEEGRASSSVIEVSQTAGGERTVLVREAVGVVAVGDIELVVVPKIPYPHFLHLAQESKVVPRTETEATEIAPSASFWEIVASWFIQATERLLHGELARGYRETRDQLERSRGRVLPLETAHAYYAGRPVLECEFEEFSEDIALNRLLKAAADLVASSSVLDISLRQRARRVLTRMTEVGAIQHSDYLAIVDRLTHRYGTSIAFAKFLLRRGGVTVSHGSLPGWCFLIRTPDLIESGVRSILQRTLGQRWAVQKKGRVLADAGFTLNPDLLFGGGLAIGDVKYKLLGSEWARADLYQCVAFAAGFNCTSAALIGFGDSEERSVPQNVSFGSIRVAAFAWDVNESSNPATSATKLSAEIAGFLASAERESGSQGALAAVAQ